MKIVSLLLSENEKSYCGKYERYVNNIIAACNYVKNNFERRITLEDISSKANLSPGFFHTVFKSIKGSTPSEYVIRIRLENAKDLLKNSDVPLADIALLCGFGSQAYFNYAFKKQSGLTPKNYRDKNRIII